MSMFQTTTSMFDDMEFDDRMIEILSIISPHQFMDESSLYGENNINDLLQYSDFSKAWPKFNICPISNELPLSQISNFYNNLFKKMMGEYIDCAIKSGGIHAYDAINNHKNKVDIINLFSHRDTLCEPCIAFHSDEIDTLRNFGWKSFIPCFDEMVIHVNKRRYFFIKLEEIDEEHNSFTITFKDYPGGKREWNHTSAITTKLIFGEETSDGLPFKYEQIESESYEQFLVKYVSETNWTKPQKQFWSDVLGVSYDINPLLINLHIKGNEESKYTTLLRNRKSLTKLKKLLGNDIVVTTLANGYTDTLKRCTTTKMLIRFIKTIAATNYLLHTGIDEMTTNDDGSVVIKCGKMVITSEHRPVNRLTGGVY